MIYIINKNSNTFGKIKCVQNPISGNLAKYILGKIKCVQNPNSGNLAKYILGKN